MATTLEHLNRCSSDEFVALVGPIFEQSPWIAASVVARRRRPFASRADLHAALCDVVRRADDERQIALIQAHPDLVGADLAGADLVGQTALTAASSREQEAAGLSDLTPEEADQFDRYNTAYKARFGFPFVICARQHRKDAILRAFPERLDHERDEEIAIALDQIFEIARLRLGDLLP